MVATAMPEPRTAPTVRAPRKNGVLVVSYGAREAAMVDALYESPHDLKLYVADKQRNPFNVARATKHVVVPDLNVRDIADFARQYQDDIAFGITGTEAPIIAGLRNVVEAAAGIPMLCPTKEYAIESSKVRQRELLRILVPDANPRYEVIEPGQFAKDEFAVAYQALGGKVVIKPDRPGFGKGVAVAGDHFVSFDEAWEHCRSILDAGDRVIVEEKLDGEEFSVQFFSDGRHLVATPPVRDFKRRYNGDRGPNTGGMGAYKADGWLLPFMAQRDWNGATWIAERVFSALKVGDYNAGVRGMPLYIGYMATADGVKVLEINSRPGDPEFPILMPLMEDDFASVCQHMLQGNLDNVRFSRQASVGVYAVPEPYPSKDGKERRVDTQRFDSLARIYGNRLVGYPAAMERRNGADYALASRTFLSIATGDDIEAARLVAMKGVRALGDEEIDYRTDIAAQSYIRRSVDHMQQLRS